MSRFLGVALYILIAGSLPAVADAVSDFYQGKQIRFVVRTPPGGDYDQYTRLLARFMGKHIPGNPTLIAVNMPGGGGITAANYMAQVAPRDGTVIGIVSQGLAADQALGLSPQLKADLREFNWIANVIYSNQLLVVWHTSPTKTLADAKRRETTIGTTGAGSASVQYPAFYNNVLGTKFKIVFGYPGGQHIDLAMERGEVEGRGTNPYTGYMASKPTWIPQKLIVPLIQVGVEKEPALPDVPLLLDLVQGEDAISVVKVISLPTAIGLGHWVAPGVPKDRLDTLRAAYQATLNDPEFLKEAEKQSMMIRPQAGTALDGLVKQAAAAPKATLARTARILRWN